MMYLVRCLVCVLLIPGMAYALDAQRECDPVVFEDPAMYHVDVVHRPSELLDVGVVVEAHEAFMVRMDGEQLAERQRAQSVCVSAVPDSVTGEPETEPTRSNPPLGAIFTGIWTIMLVLML